MTYVIDLSFIDDENPACWRNFVDSINTANWSSSIANELKQNYSAELNFKDKQNSLGPVLEFNNENDRIRFILKWT